MLNIKFVNIVKNKDCSKTVCYYDVVNYIRLLMYDSS